MIEREDLLALTDVRVTDHLVTSLYLNVDSSQRPQKGYLTVFKNLAKEVLFPPGTTRDQEKSVESDLSRLATFLESRPDFAPSRGLAAFSSSEAEFWKVYPLPIPVPDRVAVLDRPMVSPLFLVASRHQPGLVVQASRGGGKISHVYLGQIERLLRVESDVPSDVREAGFAGYEESRISRRVEELTDKHLRNLVAVVKELWEREGYRWVILAGTEEMTSHLADMLPHGLGVSVLGETVLSEDAPLAEVLMEAQRLEAKARREWEQEAVSRLMSGLKSGEPVAVGLRDACSASFRSAVRTLLVADGAARQGHLCGDCRHLIPSSDRCPNCRGDNLILVHDLVDKLVERVLKAGSNVEAVGDEYGLAECEGVGAFLRF